MGKTKKLALYAMGVALFVVLSFCLQVPVFENYYLCLGYLVLEIYCYFFGPFAGAATGFFGVILYCVLISGLRGMPGWALGNIVIGLSLGFVFARTKGLKSSLLRMVLCVGTIAVSCAAGILAVKSGTESVLYGIPFFARTVQNFPAFAADAFVLAAGFPLCLLMEKPVRRLLPELA